jgi:hypothetical protein
VSVTVCIGTANTLRYPQGGHLWVFLNWALGFRAAGVDRVLWLDVANRNDEPAVRRERIALLRSRLAPYGLADAVALVTPDGEALPDDDTGCVGPDEAAAAELLFDLRYDLPGALVRRFSRSALLDIDPGILQNAIAGGHMPLAPHDVYFTIGEGVGAPGWPYPTLGQTWIHIPPCVSTQHWPAQPPLANAAYTTVSHWEVDEWMVEADGTWYKNDKQAAFRAFLDLPRNVAAPLELAIHLAGDCAEQARVEAHGWRVSEAHNVAASPHDFQRYVQHSRGEFGCAKPAYVRMRTSWISDRTVCYLASGRPVVIQDTGPSRHLDGRDGVRRFRTLAEAIACVRDVEAAYDAHASAARALAEEHFDARAVASRVLDHVLG